MPCNNLYIYITLALVITTAMLKVNYDLCKKSNADTLLIGTVIFEKKNTVIVNNSININKTNNHLSFNIKKDLI